MQHRASTRKMLSSHSFSILLLLGSSQDQPKGDHEKFSKPGLYICVNDVASEFLLFILSMPKSCMIQ